MQSRGPGRILVAIFTVLLVLYSLYMLSFTWSVRSHENKMEAKAKQYVNSMYASLPQAEKDSLIKLRLKRLLDSTKEETITYGLTGGVSYQKAKEEELNLGLDLQGGVNVTMEVELAGLLKSMANNSKDPNFLKALENANVRKANSSEDFISLFREEYKKLNPNGRLASLFATANPDRIKITDSDDKVIAEIRNEANNAFDRTYRVLRTRIDQFGVAQPNINPDKDRKIITVELPGIQDQERVRKYLQASANLEFWEVYKLEELSSSLDAVDKAYAALVAGGTPASATPDTAKASPDTTGSATATTDTAGGLLSKEATAKKDTSKTMSAKKSFFQEFFVPGMGGLAVATKDTAIVREYLNKPELRNAFPADVRFAYGIPPRDKNGKTVKAVPLYFLKTNGSDKAPMEGGVVTEARASYDQLGRPSVTMQTNAAGSRQWEALTRRSFEQKRPIAIVLDDIVYSAPTANNGPISGGNTEISGSFTAEEATDLANILKAGKLPAPAKIVQEQVVGPTLGKDAVQGGIMAFVISFAVIFLLMLVYYNTSGWVANIALILNLLFTIGVLTGLGATLTAPGIAGLVLTIGMAVDTNVIIYERIKEELTKGKGYIPAVNEGYRRSLPPVLDAHVTTLLTAIILFSFGLGPVKGFATTQILGILLSLFCGILVSRWVTDWFTNKKRHLEYFTPISRRIFKHASYKFIEYRKVAYGISIVVLILGVASLFHGFDQGVEFKGGRSFMVSFNQVPNVEAIRNDLAKAFGEAPVIKTIGNDRQLDITTSYQIENTAADATDVVKRKLYEGLQNHLPAGISYATFDQVHEIGSTTVLPTISDDLKAGAVKATIFSLLIICLYIFIRFRDWRYSVGTIIALLHDVLVTLAVFSFLKDIVPFPLELDQHFIAAVLTVIGFSMNDTVIVFDRIREYSRQMIGAPKETIINKAINETLSRTIMTSLTVFLTILILFIFGGEVTRGFAFAMLIGVITGTYSSIFVAAPVLVDLGKGKALTKNQSSDSGSSNQRTKPELAKHA